MKRLPLLVLLALSVTGAPGPLTEDAVRAALTPPGDIDISVLKAMGPAVLPHLVHIYRTTPDEQLRATYAWVFYSLGMKSPEARAALLRDIDTPNPTLRLQVQWALGRVSDDTGIVDILAGIMRNDANPLFRDKAACALAYDQIHLTKKQKVKLYRTDLAVTLTPFVAPGRRKLFIDRWRETQALMIGNPWLPTRPLLRRLRPHRAGRQRHPTASLPPRLRHDAQEPPRIERCRGHAHATYVVPG